MYKKKEKKLEYTKRKMRLMTYIYIIGLINGFNTDTKLNCTEIHNTTFLFFFLSNKSFVEQYKHTKNKKKLFI